MGHGRLRPERRSSRFEIGSARQIQFSKNWDARMRSGRSPRRSGVHGFLSFTGVWLSFYLCFPLWEPIWMSAVTAQCELVLCVTESEEPQNEVDLSLGLCVPTHERLGSQCSVAELGPCQVALTGQAPAGDHTRTREHQRATDPSHECESVHSMV